MTTSISESTSESTYDPVWNMLRKTAQEHADQEPVLASYMHATILNHNSLEDALSFHLANKLGSPTAPALLIREIVEEALAESDTISQAVRADIVATYERDSAFFRAYWHYPSRHSFRFYTSYK